MDEASHIPVLKTAVVEAFSGCLLNVFVDGTLGLGGHASLILKEHPEINEYIGIDQDQAALLLAEKKLLPFKNKLKLLKSNFSDALDHIPEGSVDGILLDLGVSSMQLDEDERGFSFRKAGPLDMRMDKSQSLTAEEIVNTYSEEDLGRIFREFGEEKQWKKAARAIVKARSVAPLKTTLDLAQILQNVLFSKKPYKIHPATLIFQALRIAVNDELGVISNALPKALKALKKNGVIAVISFHSLEDRIVKQYFQKESLDKESTSGQSGLFINKEPKLVIKTRKPIEATDQEIDENPRSRSARLRIAKKR